MIFLLPSEPFNIKKVDYEFQSELTSISILGFKSCLYDHDRFISTGEFVSNIDDTNDLIILRSWMLTSDQYRSMWDHLSKMGNVMINTHDQYLNCHYYPRVYSKISNHTSLSVWSNDLSDESIISLRKLISDDVIIKDYVKSEKESDTFILGKDISNNDLIDKVKKFREYRGKLFNEGIVFKRKLNLKKYGDKTNDFSLFYLYHKLISISQNSNFSHGNNPYIGFLDKVIEKIDSNFFTIDLAELEDGSWAIIECGDGSVSGLSPNQNNLVFYMNFNPIQETIKVINE